MKKNTIDTQVGTLGEQDVTPYNQYSSHTLSMLQCYKLQCYASSFSHYSY